MTEINKDNFLKELFIDEAKPALKWFDIRWGNGNILDMNSVDPNDNKYISASNGRTQSPTTGVWLYTDFAPVEPNVTYKVNQIHASASLAGLAWYDSEQQYISGVNNTKLAAADGVIVAPENAAYIRHSFRVDEGYNVDWKNTVSIVRR